MRVFTKQIQQNPVCQRAACWCVQLLVCVDVADEDLSQLSARLQPICTIVATVFFVMLVARTAGCHKVVAQS